MPMVMSKCDKMSEHVISFFQLFMHIGALYGRNASSMGEDTTWSQNGRFVLSQHENSVVAFEHREELYICGHRGSMKTSDSYVLHRCLREYLVV